MAAIDRFTVLYGESASMKMVRAARNAGLPGVAPVGGVGSGECGRGGCTPLRIG